MTAFHWKLSSQCVVLEIIGSTELYIALGCKPLYKVKVINLEDERLQWQKK